MGQLQWKSGLSGLCYRSCYGWLGRYVVQRERVPVLSDIPAIVRLDHLQTSSTLLCNPLGVGTNRQRDTDEGVPGVVEGSGRTLRTRSTPVNFFLNGSWSMGKPWSSVNT